MSSRSALPASHPLPEGAGALLDQLANGLDAPGLWWVSGYLAGLAQRQPPATGLSVVRTAPATAPGTLTLVYGSQTGHARALAETLEQRLRQAGQAVRLLRADAYRLRELASERHLLIVISTHGDGEPPDDARDFVEHLLGARAPKLPELQFAVLALGDSSYPQFCHVGRQLDARLEALGATRWLPRADADVDVETIATPWLDAVAAKAATLPAGEASGRASVTPLRPAATVATRERPGTATVLVNQRITGAASSKDVRHLELALDAGLVYEPGDAIGVRATQAPALVEAMLASLGLDGEAVVSHAGQSLPLRAWLTRERELTRLSSAFLAAHAQRADSAELTRLLADDAAAERRALLARWQPLDLLQRHRADWDAPGLVAALAPLQPRLYSIASSPKAVGEQAHLTVAHVHYLFDDAPRWGVASHDLSGQGEDATLPVFIERNERFRLPRDGARDIVMIAAGVGIAPFRGFVQDRRESGARGRHWLLFGERSAREDFLYQLEWQRARKEGVLHRLDLAFSRQGPARGHVDDRIIEHGRELHAWLAGGAHLYVCGSVAMGRSVEAALVAAITRHGGMDDDAATHWLRELQREGRYARDVY